VRLAPNGNDDTEYKYLLEISWQWQSSMVTAKVTHSAAEFGIWQMILHKLVYPLVTMTFTQKQCAEIMQPILAQGLPSAGFVRSFSRAIILLFLTHRSLPVTKNAFPCSILQWQVPEK